jgi:hypothetical protein
MRLRFEVEEQPDDRTRARRVELADNREVWTQAGADEAVCAFD